ncbi:MAG: hypothetical protein IPJ76_03690 [Flavobacteriales bacterium]|nr:MAG: hypothetical protein IPJ76_03690 [Flavobacteriales bacterium]
MTPRLPNHQPVIALVVFVGLLCIRAAPPVIPEREYEIHFVGPITAAGEKYLIEGLVDQDPEVRFWIDRPTQSALARTTVHLDQAALQEVITPSGLVIGYMGLLSEDPTVPVEGPARASFPVYIDAGDPTIDAPRYLQAKTAWFAAHKPSGSPLIDQ